MPQREESALTTEPQKRLTLVFVVEDHERLRKLIISFLATLKDIKVIGDAASAEAALEHAEFATADIILTDLNMPGITGIELAKKISEEFSNKQVILLTAHDDSFYADKAFEAGASAYIVKNDPSIIGETINRVLAGEDKIISAR